MVRLFRRIIIISIVSFTISYAFFSLISMEDSNLATVAVLSWLAIIILE